MCTILTISRELYNTHKDAVVAQIRSDARSNSHGFSMLTIGTEDTSAELLRTLNVESLLSSLEYQLSLTANAERAWVHLRYATTEFTGLNGCHGFAAGDYTVFHNGILSRRESNGFNVDSELIAFDIESSGLEGAIANIASEENYVNAMLVNNQTGQYTVIRLSVGSLYTDGLGNYSTHEIKAAGISMPVPKQTRTDFTASIIDTRSSLMSFAASLDHEYADDAGPWYPRSSHAYTSADADAASGVNPTILDILYAIDECDVVGDFSDVAAYYNFDLQGFPLAVYDCLDVIQLQWFSQCGFWWREYTDAEIDDLGDASAHQRGIGA